jgi:MFS family permease
MAAASLWSTLFTPFMGQLFEVFGRRAVISMNYAIMIFFIWLSPYSATMLKVPSLEILKFCRVAVTVCSTFLLTSPLTVDYIKSESQGKGTSINEMGSTIGAFIGMSLLLNLCQDWDQKQSFGLCSSVMACITVLSMFWIRNAPRKTPLDVGLAMAEKTAAKAAVKDGQPADVKAPAPAATVSYDFNTGALSEAGLLARAPVADQQPAAEAPKAAADNEKGNAKDDDFQSADKAAADSKKDAKANPLAAKLGAVVSTAVAKEDEAEKAKKAATTESGK